MPGIVQVRNSEMVGILGADFQGRHEPGFGWMAGGGPRLLPGLRGLWTMASVDNVPAVYDASGQGRTLSATGGITFGSTDLAQWAHSAGSPDYLSRVDEAGLDTLCNESCYIGRQGMSAGCWVKFNHAATAVETIMAKWGAVGNYCWKLDRTAAGLAQFSISGDGTVRVSATSTGTVMAANTWYAITGRHYINSKVSVFVNAVEFTTATAITTLFDSTADFTIFASGDPAARNYMDGYTSMAYLCATRLLDCHVFSIYHQTRAAYGV